MSSSLGVNNTLWSACDRGDTAKVRKLLSGATEEESEGAEQQQRHHRDVNGRNCLGCTPLLYACGSGHLETVRLLLAHPDIDVNRRNNDRLTSFMLAMQCGGVSFFADAAAWAGWGTSGARGATATGAMGATGTTTGSFAAAENAQEKMKRLMDVPATDDLEWTRHDRWTALMEACNFGHGAIVELLLQVPNLDLEAVNLRGQRAEEVAVSRGYDHLADMIGKAKQDRENPEELPRIQKLEKEVESLKLETRQRLSRALEQKYSELRAVKADHEMEIEPLSAKIDLLQTQLEEAMKQRLGMITRQVRDLKNKEEEIRQVKRKMDNFDRCCNNTPTATVGNNATATAVSSSNPNLSAAFEKDFECSVCLEDMRPPTKIFQCRNGHVMCEQCQSHPDVTRCPSCRLPLRGCGAAAVALFRNLPMEKLARSFFEQPLQQPRSRPHSRRGSGRRLLSAGGLSQSSETAFLEWMQ